MLQAKQSLATLTKDVPKRHSLAMPTEAVVNGNQEWVMHAEMPLTAAIRQSQHSLYHTLDRHGTLIHAPMPVNTSCNIHLLQQPHRHRQAVESLFVCMYT